MINSCNNIAFEVATSAILQRFYSELLQIVKS